MRDMTIAHEFAESYIPTATGPQADGERPSTFGLTNYIDNVWMLNGFRYDQGTPTFVRFDGATGGIGGLLHLGTSFDVTVGTDAITLSGDLVTGGGVCATYSAAPGVSQPLTDACPAVTLSADTVAQGGTVTVSASGLPASAAATIDLHSDPVRLAEATTNADGGLPQVSATIPAGTPVGEHTVVVTVGGVSTSASLTVTAASTGGSNGSGGTGSAPTTVAGGAHAASLATTGGVLWLGVPVIAAMLLAAGLAIVIARRRNLTR